MMIRPIKFLCLILGMTTCDLSHAQVKPIAPPVAIDRQRRGTLVNEVLVSQVLRENKIGLDPNRKIIVYLPAGYATSRNAFPVVYYFHNIFQHAEKVFEDGRVVELLERSFAEGVVKDFILVAADFSTPSCGSLYENSPVSGRWIDFVTQELVPHMDDHYRTLSNRNSRALVGDFMGGRGALKLAMDHSDMFSVVYALHPVATGMGSLPWSYVPVDWKKIHEATSVADLQGDARAQIFVSICQGFLPNVSRPPFYCDFFVENVHGELKINTAYMAKAKLGFHLEETLAACAANLGSMHGIAIDWARFDPNQDHVYANREFSRKLEDLGIEHEAEEYRGSPSNQLWTDYGRFYTRVLPFLNRYLTFK